MDRKDANVKISVDVHRCQDHGQCVFVAPDIFSLDDGGHNRFVSTVDADRRGDVEEAMDACPMGAISIDDD